MASKIRVPLKFGDCSSGWHEAPGGKYTPGDRPLPACRGLLIYSVSGIERVHLCGCDCHDQITAMFEEMGIPRAWPEISWRSEADRQAFKASQPQFNMSFLDDFKRAREPVALPANATDAAPRVHELEDGETKREVASIIPPNPKVTVDPDWKPGSGPRPKGGLELEVKLACDAWVLGAHPGIEVLKPHHISRLISADRPPSTGAIVNILIAWGDIGFAITKTSPHRFLGYTEAGIKLGIEPLRERRSMTAASDQRNLKVRMLRGHRT